MTTSYRFNVVIEAETGFDGNPDGWHAFCPALELRGASTWGATYDEALAHITEVLRIVIESMIEHGEAIPEADGVGVEVVVQPRVAALA